MQLSKYKHYWLVTSIIFGPRKVSDISRHCANSNAANVYLGARGDIWPNIPQNWLIDCWQGSERWRITSKQRCSTHKGNRLTQSDSTFLHLTDIKNSDQIKQKIYNFYCATLFFDMLHPFKTWTMTVFHNVLSQVRLRSCSASSAIHTTKVCLINRSLSSILSVLNKHCEGNFSKPSFLIIYPRNLD